LKPVPPSAHTAKETDRLSAKGCIHEPDHDKGNEAACETAWSLLPASASAKARQLGTGQSHAGEKQEGGACFLEEKGCEQSQGRQA
jgi:hypothetical protein